MTSNVTPEEKTRGPIFLTASQVESLPDLEWLVPGILPKPGFGVLFGEPGCGKTFVALSLALSLANGEEWVGRKVSSANVLYIAAEGIYGLKTRVSAFRQVYKINDERVRFTASQINVLEDDQIEMFLASLKETGFHPDLIIFDTLARVTVGANENNAMDMGRAVAGLDRFKTAFNAFVLVLHHTTKNGYSERGSSALRGAADVMIECTSAESKGGLEVTLICSKMKDAEPFKTFTASLDKTELPSGASSLVMGGEVDPTSVISNINADRVLDIITEQFANNGETYAELLKAFIAAKFGSKSSFDRGLRDLKWQKRIRSEGKGKGRLYFPISVSVKSVS